MEQSFEELTVAIGATTHLTEQIKDAKQLDPAVPCYNATELTMLSKVAMNVKLGDEK